MPRLTKSQPAYRHHKASGQAVVSIDRRTYYLGRYGSPESKAEYDRVVAEWLASGRRATKAASRTGPLATGDVSGDLTVNEVVLAYWRFAEHHYSRDGTTARELDNIRDALRHIAPLYGHTQAAAFGPRALKTLRQSMVTAGLARTTINARVQKIVRVFRWASSEELIPPSVYHGLKAVEGLRRGQDGTREAPPVRPVTDEQVAAVLPFVSEPIKAMIMIQDLTGMRPGEVMAMRGCEIDRSEAVWVYRPSRHKTLERGKSRAIAIGPRAQAILTGWLREDPEEFLFSPAEAVARRNVERRRNRRSPMTPSQAARRPKRDPKRAPRKRYDRWSYNNAIERACDKAHPHPMLDAIPKDHLTPEQQAELKAWRRQHRWHPNRLRHGTATRIRRLYDVEAAQVVLGHSKMNTTLIYAERHLGQAMAIAREIG